LVFTYSDLKKAFSHFWQLGKIGLEELPLRGKRIKLFWDAKKSRRKMDRVADLYRPTETQKMKIIEDLCRHNVQITFHDEVRESAVASSVFLSYKGRCFLLTSGHTFSGSSMDSFGVNLGGTWYRLSHFSQWMVALPNHFVDDDCAMFLLSEEISKALESEYKPLYLFEKDFVMAFNENAVLTFVGYPWKKIRFHPKHNGLVRRPYSSWISGRGEKLRFIKGKNKCDLFEFPFSKKGTTKGPDKERVRFPKMQGISGSGLFSVYFSSPITYSINLVGILNEEKVETEGKRKSEEVRGYHIVNFKPMLDSMVKE
jgi:hypothetical protein